MTRKSGFYVAREIIDGLWIGSSADARDPTFLRRHRIGLVVNCTRTVPFNCKGLLGYRVAIDDNMDENETIYNYFPTTSRIIDEALESGKGVLVHCYAGISRSSSVVAAYLMYKLGLSPTEAIRIIRSQKPETFKPYIVFLPALRKYHSTM
jgi:dual specificity phosphatase 12